MENNLNELGYVEQELAELRHHLQQTFKVLDALAEIPVQFEQLRQAYKDLRQQLDERKDNREEFTQVKAALNERIAQLETAIDSRWTEFKGEFTRLQDELSTADIHLSNYNAELAKQVSEIREEVAKRLKNFWQEWVSNEATQASLGQIIDTKLDTELAAFIQQLGEAGFNAQHFEKPEMLETELRLTQSSLRELERQLQLIRNFTIVTGLTVAVTLGLVILQLIN